MIAEIDRCPSKPICASSSCSRPGMVLLVNSSQAIQCHMRVHLGSRDVGVSENGLHRAQVGAVFNQVSGTAMAHHVRTRMPAGEARRTFHNLPCALACKFAPTRGMKKVGRGPQTIFCASLLQMVRQRSLGSVAKWN